MSEREGKRKWSERKRKREEMVREKEKEEGNSPRCPRERERK